MDRVSFLLNGEPQSVGCEVSSNVMLLDYLREGKDLRGTKYFCREGGCGACVVAAARPGQLPHAVNSCLVAVTSCQDWEITTVEGVGNRLQGYHRVQKTLAKYNGTQCGYCSPGWIMAMYSLLQSKKNLTMLEIEQSFGSNICRCTGYRPILEAFKTFSSDAPDSNSLLDIEDLNICKRNNKPCSSTCSETDWCLIKAGEDKNIQIKLKDGRLWFRVHSVADIFNVLKDKGDNCYMLVAGNTAKGAYPIDVYPEVLIDISGVSELKGHYFDQNLVLGAGCTLTETMDTFESIAKTEDSFWYLEKLRQHLLLVAHIPVRNLGTLAGNLMTKHAHNDFQSDVFLLFETVGAYLTLVDSSGTQERVTPESFLRVDMQGKVILDVLLPPLSREYKFTSFKIMPRAQNAHAIVNAGYLYKLNSSNEVSEARIVYGGLSPQFVHAKETEKFIVGRKLFNSDALQAALKVMNKELVVVENPPEPSVQYRKNLALNLFYKGLLSLAPSSAVSARYASGGITLSHTRPVSSARQVYTTNPLIYPLNQPIEKVEALIQCAGEAPYTEDLPSMTREVFGAFVLSTIGVGDIDHMDADEALNYPGVVAFYTAKDIPGVNSFTFGDNIAMPVKEEVFCPGPVEFNGQVIGLIVAETRQSAETATKLVKVTYKNVKKPVVDIKEAIKDSERVTVVGEYSSSSNVDTGLIKVIKGGHTIYAQHHFCMETLVCVTKPTEEGLEVHCSTQHMDGVQVMVARALNYPQHKIDVHVRRLGGSYGVKISRSNQVAVACALATHKLGRPCRMMLPLTTFSKAVGKRLPCSADYEIMPRAQNAHAIVNAGYLYKLNSSNEVSEARIVYGGLSPQFVHAKETEKFIVGRKLFNSDALQAALKVMNKELVVVENPPEPSVQYRKNLALNLFYKGLLSLAPSSAVSARYASGGITLSHTRPVSSARQVYTTNPLIYPLNQPIEKVEALIQCAGEAPYTEDLPSMTREVFGAFVLSTIGVGDIDHMDADEALNYPGVVAFYTAKDIPGVNSFTFGDNIAMPVKEEVFCPGPVEFNGQVIGLIVAETRQSAETATKLVKVTYKNVKKPVVDIKEAIKDSERVTVVGEYSSSSNVDTGLIKVIKGGHTIYAQHHFCMETLVCVTKPTEEGLEVHCSTQHMDGVQVMVARALNYPQHKIDVHVRRLGGSYGVKISRSNQVAVACALATHKLGRPCRMMLPLTTFSKAVGKRLPCSADYEVAVDVFGKMIYCKEKLYLDNGYVFDEPVFLPTLDAFNNCYEKLRFSYRVHDVTTNTASNTWCRSPGYLEAISSAEFIMERIAYELSIDPIEVRLRNLNPLYSVLRLLVLRVKSEGQYEERRAAVDKFNAQNRWKKRGLRFTLLRWQPTYPPNFGVTMSVYHEDGTVAISHGGIDMGQGLNTKAVQIAAFILKIPIGKIQIKENNTIISPNAFVTGDSSTSIIIGIGVRRCCEELLLRLAPIKVLLPLASWEEQIKAAFLAGIDLQTHGFVGYLDIQRAPVFGVTLAEVEIDVLTGEWEILRVDILEDVGQSISPEIDVGQVEGAFIMGLGYWTTEHLVYDPITGELLTNRTWNYHVPQARDIPQDFRVYFRNKSYSEPRIFGAKSVGEPPICMSLAVLFAMREGIAAAREDTGKSRKDWFQIDGPFSREAIQLNTATEYTEFKFS